MSDVLWSIQRPTYVQVPTTRTIDVQTSERRETMYHIPIHFLLSLCLQGSLGRCQLFGWGKWTLYSRHEPYNEGNGKQIKKRGEPRAMMNGLARITDQIAVIPVTRSRLLVTRLTRDRQENRDFVGRNVGQEEINWGFPERTSFSPISHRKEKNIICIFWAGFVYEGCVQL